MADDKVTAICKALAEVLNGTGLFAAPGGIPYARDETGPRPSFMVWWDSFSDATELQSGAQLPQLIHRLQVDFFVTWRGKGTDREDQERLRQIVLACGKAIQRNHRLNGTCLAARMRNGESDVKPDPNNMMYTMSTIVEARVSEW